MTKEEISRMARAVYEQQDEMRPVWDWLAQKIMPRKADVLRQVRAAEFVREHCSTASQSLEVLVSGFLSHVMPSGEVWFRFEHGGQDRTQTYELWYQNANDVTYRELAGSAFYYVMQEVLTDRALFGTCCALCERKRGGGLSFHHVPVGSFGFQRNSDGVVDTLCRKFKYTPAQAVQKFGYEKLPDVVRRAYDRERERFTREFEFFHFVTPREGYTRGNAEKLPAHARAYLSVYIFNGGTFPIVEEGGYEEFPYFVSNFLPWEGVWGYPPGLKVMDEMASLMLSERHLDELGALAVYPRMLIDAEQEGDIDFRAGAQTVVDRNVAGYNLPREWGTQGRYDVGVERVERADKKIKEAFFVPFLHAVSDVDRQMTATEVVARQREQVLSISATFTLFVYDFNAFLGRIFAVLWRDGAYNTGKGMQPVDLVVREGVDSARLETPKVKYLGRIAQCVELAQKQNLDYGLQSAAQWVQLTGDTSALDLIDVSKVLEWIFKTAGAPSDIFRKQADVKKLRDERQQQAMAQQQLALGQAANAEAQAVKNMRQ